MSDTQLIGGTMSNTQLRKAVIRLAHAKPELRPHLLPLLGKTARRPDPKRMTPEDAEEMVQGIMLTVADLAQEYIRFAQDEISNQHGHVKDIKRAWGRWDWRMLENLNLISREDRRFVDTVQSMYSW